MIVFQMLFRTPTPANWQKGTSAAVWLDGWIEGLPTTPHPDRTLICSSESRLETGRFFSPTWSLHR